MEWTAPDVVRRTAPPVAGERESLEGWLDHHRDTLLWKCRGLTAEQLVIRPIASSTLSLIGLVRHLAEVERIWFRYRFAGEDVGPIFGGDGSSGPSFDDVLAETADRDLGILRDEIEACRRTVAGRSLDEAFVFGRDRRDRDLRWVYVHMIEEYARHNGHADIVRELIDGTTGA